MCRRQGHETKLRSATTRLANLEQQPSGAQPYCPQRCAAVPCSLCVCRRQGHETKLRSATTRLANLEKQPSGAQQERKTRAQMDKLCGLLGPSVRLSSCGGMFGQITAASTQRVQLDKGQSLQTAWRRCWPVIAVMFAHHAPRPHVRAVSVHLVCMSGRHIPGSAADAQSCAKPLANSPDTCLASRSTSCAPWRSWPSWPSCVRPCVPSKSPTALKRRPCLRMARLSAVLEEHACRSAAAMLSSDMDLRPSPKALCADGEAVRCAGGGGGARPGRGIGQAAPDGLRPLRLGPVCRWRSCALCWQTLWSRPEASPGSCSRLVHDGPEARPCMQMEKLCAVLEELAEHAWGVAAARLSAGELRDQVGPCLLLMPGRPRRSCCLPHWHAAGGVRVRVLGQRWAMDHWGACGHPSAAVCGARPPRLSHSNTRSPRGVRSALTTGSAGLA